MATADQLKSQSAAQYYPPYDLTGEIYVTPGIQLEEPPALTAGESDPQQTVCRWYCAIGCLFLVSIGILFALICLFTPSCVRMFHPIVDWIPVQPANPSLTPHGTPTPTPAPQPQ